MSFRRAAEAEISGEEKTYTSGQLTDACHIRFLLTQRISHRLFVEMTLFLNG
jgi:hypothetical protein